MANTLRFRKVNSVPGVLETSTIYIVKQGSNHVLYITDKNGTVSYKSYDSTDIAAVSSAYIDGLIGQPDGIAGLDTNGDYVGDITGNAATATKLQTARSINGVSFDGSQNISISAAVAVKETTLDFGSVGMYSKSFTITDIEAVTTNKILISASSKPASGRSQDELEMDNFSCSAVCSVNGQIIINISAVPGPVTGQYVFNYTLG